VSRSVWEVHTKPKMIGVNDMLRVIQKALLRKGILLGKWPATDFQSPSLIDLILGQPWVLDKKEAFIFVQVGANDGISGGDPIRKHLLQNKWKGLMIEPNPVAFSKLQHLYEHQPNITLENVAIAPAKGVGNLYVNPNENTTGSMILGVAQHQNPSVKLDVFEVTCIPLDQVLQKHRISAIDLLQIDTEGFELSVLKSLDFNRVSPKIIHFEHGHLSRHHISQLFELLNAKGYEIHFGGRQNDSIALLQ
jgi:FkbM family methyltransferase